MSLARFTPLNLESLDERLVPSATTLDLTTKGAAAIAFSGAIVRQVDPQPTGTGYVHAFVRIQGAASGGGVEQGYNTDGRPLQFDENKSPAFTRSITLDKVPVVTVNGVTYREFLLGINQKSSSPYLSLDEVRIFLGNVPTLTGYDTTTNTLAGQSAVFDLDSGGDVSVKLNAALSTGNGSGDMALLVPNAAFAGASPSSYLYLYSKMGGLAGASANGGFEQWFIPSTPPTLTPPAVGSLSGSVVIPSETPGTVAGISNVLILLQGTDSMGNTVNLSTTTDVNGAFSFNNLAAGTYTIIQVLPIGFTGTAEVVGTVGGSMDGIADPVNAQFTTISLGAGQNGTGYLFQDY